MAPVLDAFLRCADLGNDAYLVDGDVVTPELVTATAPHLSAVRSVAAGLTYVDMTGDRDAKLECALNALISAV